MASTMAMPPGGAEGTKATSSTGSTKSKSLTLSSGLAIAKSSLLLADGLPCHC
jgi:hypothetical protein